MMIEDWVVIGGVLGLGMPLFWWMYKYMPVETDPWELEEE